MAMIEDVIREMRKAAEVVARGEDEIVGIAGEAVVCWASAIEAAMRKRDAEIERLHGQIHTLLERGDELRNDKKELREIIAIREDQLEHCRKDAERMQKEIEHLKLAGKVQTGAEIERDTEIERLKEEAKWQRLWREAAMVDAQKYSEAQDEIKRLRDELWRLTRELTEADIDVHLLREALQAFKDFDDLPREAKRPDVFELRVRQPILAALKEDK
jgi:chromosome segregation ATPase